MNNDPAARFAKPGDFFAVDLRCWRKVLDQSGMNGAAAYLVLARGQGPLRRKSPDGHGLVDCAPETCWSADAIARYTGMDWKQSSKLIDALQQLDMLEKIRGGTKPRYRFRLFSEMTDSQSASTWTFIPFDFVAPNKSETVELRQTPLQRLMQTGRKDLLRCHMELYGEHDLARYGGVSFATLRKDFERNLLATYGSWTVWAFEERVATSAMPPEGMSENELLAAVSELERMALGDFVPHALNNFDEADIEDFMIRYPAAQTGSGEVEEQRLGEAQLQAARALLPDFFEARWAKSGPPEILLVERTEWSRVSVIGVFRLRARPRTAGTLEWASRSGDFDQAAEAFAVMAREANESRGRHAGTGLRVIGR